MYKWGVVYKVKVGNEWDFNTDLFEDYQEAASRLKELSTDPNYGEPALISIGTVKRYAALWWNIESHIKNYEGME